ncbi:MAG TPA: hypothetical protein VNW30_11815 [Opitutaceae bacterium]|jgi:hypothetical protein|nr:hypothetical protein [Opitutaceae bacterium]
MPLPDDRLQELRRQRALVQEHLAWLDREIVSASSEATPPKPAAQSQPPAPPAGGNDVVEVIKSFEAESRSNPAKAKWGCIWIFVATLALMALCLFAFYRYVSLHQSPPVR